MLKLSARIWNRNPKHAWIQISQNGGNTGSLLCVEAKHADELVGLLNATTELLAVAQRACATCVCGSTMRPDVPCLSCAARHVVAKAKGGT